MGDHHATDYHVNEDAWEPTLQPRMWWFQRRTPTEFVLLLGEFIVSTWVLSSFLDVTSLSLAHMSIAFATLDVIIFIVWSIWDQQGIFPYQGVTSFPLSLLVLVPYFVLRALLHPLTLSYLVCKLGCSLAMVHHIRESICQFCTVCVEKVGCSLAMVLDFIRELISQLYLVCVYKLGCSLAMVRDFIRKFKFICEIVIVTFYWVFKEDVLYGDTVDSNFKVWIASLIPSWIIVLIVFIAAGTRFCLLFCKGIH